MAAPTYDANTRCQIQLIGTTYVADASKDFTTNLQRYLKDGSQAGASLLSATARWMKLLSISADK